MKNITILAMKNKKQKKKTPLLYTLLKKMKTNLPVLVRN